MAVEVGSSSPPVLPPDVNSDPVLSYSRHYAKKIHDLGKSSRETWIQTLVDHVLHGPHPNRPHQRGPGGGVRGGRSDQVSEKSYDSNNEYSPSMPRHRKDTGTAFDLAGATSRRDGRIMNSLKDSPYRPKPKIQQEAPVYLRKIVQTRDGYTHRSREGGLNTARSKGKDKDDTHSTTSSAHKAHHYPPINNAKFKDHKLKFIPQELATSPYVSHRQQYQVVPIEKVMAPRPKQRPHTRHSGPRKDHQQSAVNQRSTNPYLASAPLHHAHHSQVHHHPPAEAWRPQYAPTTAQMVALEKRAKALSAKAVKESKVFTCEAPYPVDAYVRFSMRKRGWVEKFAPRIHNNITAGKGTADKLECELDEDFDVICDHNVPAPWIEEHGIYTTMSRLVRHRPARFIWAGRAVNSMVLHQDVIVNHFPKAKHFSSKTGIASSLRDLPWLASSDPMDFFPRCYLLSEDEREDLVDDFRMTACVSLLKWVMSMFTSGDAREKPAPLERSKTIEVIHEEEAEQLPPISNQQPDTIHETNQSENKESGQQAAVDQSGEGNEDVKAPNDIAADDEPDDLDNNNIHLGEDLGEEDYDPDFASPSEDESDSDDDIIDKVSSPIQGKMGKRIKPVIVKPEKTGGEIPSKAVDWALTQCERYIRFKTHEDLDQRNKPNLTLPQWEQFLKWYYKVAHDGATVTVTESKVQKVKETLSKMRKLWKQYDIDGRHNLWIIKPGGKSKGIGIEFCNNIDDMLKYIDNTTLTGTYVVQKYIETPCLIHNTKFDIRQWFMVTDWNPLTVWFYRGSYLRICSQEFTLDSMHEAVHLSNVAIQQFYLNGERTGNLPDDNYMDSSVFQKYLESVGAGTAWENIVYPGMKRAVVNTLLATMDVAENKKGSFELYGADFMLSDNYMPWLLEINSSPGMAPTSKEKAKMCANVVEDLMKVVLDRRENKNCDTGNFELVFKDQPLPSFKSVDNRMYIEGNRIKRTDLQRYASLDNVVNSGEDPSTNEFLMQLRKKHNRKDNAAANSRTTTKQDGAGTVRDTATRGGQRPQESRRQQQPKVLTKAESSRDLSLTRSYTKIYGNPHQKSAAASSRLVPDRKNVPPKTPRTDQADRSARDGGAQKKEAQSNKGKPQQRKKAETPEAEDSEEEEDDDDEAEESEEEDSASETEEQEKAKTAVEQKKQEESEEEEEEESEEEETESEEEEESSDEEVVEVKKDEEVRVRKIDRSSDTEDENDF